MATSLNRHLISTQGVFILQKIDWKSSFTRKGQPWGGKRTTKMKVALIFWGLTRSLRFCYPFHKQHILDVLKKAGIEYDIFIHTYHFESPYSNKWSGEHHIALDFEEYKVLEAKYVIRDNQDEVCQEIQPSSFTSSHAVKQQDPLRRQAGEWFGANGDQMRENVVKSLYSKYRITCKFEEVQDQYDYCIFLRPDAQFQSPLDVQSFKRANDTTIVLANFNHFRGWNDQFAICTPKVALIYGKLFLRMKEYSQRRVIISEVYLKECLIESAVQMADTHIRYALIRARAPDPVPVVVALELSPADRKVVKFWYGPSLEKKIDVTELIWSRCIVEGDVHGKVRLPGLDRERVATFSDTFFGQIKQIMMEIGGPEQEKKVTIFPDNKTAVIGWSGSVSSHPSSVGLTPNRVAPPPLPTPARPLRFWYGGDTEKKVEVTELVFQKCMVAGRIRIPARESERTALFTDPFYGTLKQIMMQRVGVDGTEGKLDYFPAGVVVDVPVDPSILTTEIRQNLSMLSEEDPKKRQKDSSYIFVILRHIGDENHKHLWFRCYNSVRTHHPDTAIVIIDDNSKLKDARDEKLVNTSILQSEFPGRGEILPYYYFARKKWADTMIFLHDSMLLRRPFTSQELNHEVAFLWHFETHICDDNAGIEKLLTFLADSSGLIEFQRKKPQWNGCFGVTSIIRLQCLEAMEAKHDFTQKLIPHITSREMRMILERVFAILFFKEAKVKLGSCSIFGCIHSYPGNFRPTDERTLQNLIQNQHGLAVLKTWASR